MITHALDDLPAEKVGAEILTAAEAHLVAKAAEFGPRGLRILGRRILDIVAPEIGEHHEAEQLAGKATIIRDRECRADGCTIPATWCESHHAGTRQASGGHTDLNDGLLLCSWHHHLAHDTSRVPNGDLRFNQRT